jgi:hypothetical protein
MKKERQIGIRVGLPAFFALEVEDVYKHTSGAHRALAFPDFLGYLIGLGLEAYRKGNATPQEETPECGRIPPRITEILANRTGLISGTFQITRRYREGR